VAFGNDYGMRYCGLGMMTSFNWFKDSRYLTVIKMVIYRRYSSRYSLTGGLMQMRISS
jgi:hypothetical protein